MNARGTTKSFKAWHPVELDERVGWTTSQKASGRIPLHPYRKMKSGLQLASLWRHWGMLGRLVFGEIDGAIPDQD